MGGPGTAMMNGHADAREQPFMRDIPGNEKIVRQDRAIDPAPTWREHDTTARNGIGQRLQGLGADEGRRTAEPGVDRPFRAAALQT